MSLILDKTFSKTWNSIVFEFKGGLNNNGRTRAVEFIVTVPYTYGCGDGIWQIASDGCQFPNSTLMDEECDDGDLLGDDGCTADCKIWTDTEWVYTCVEDSEWLSFCYACGDGNYVSLYESCDDANNDPDDGCEPNCVITDGYNCLNFEGETSICFPC